MRRQILALLALLLPAIGLALVVVWPQALGLAGTYGPAQLVAVRGAGVAAALVVLVLLLVAALVWRRARRHLFALTAVVAVAAIVSAGVLVSRGLNADLDRASTDSEALRVLTFNTLRDGVAAPDVARLVDSQDADIVVLQETSSATTEQVAATLGDYQVFHRRIGNVTSATGLLIADHLGRYGGLEQYTGGDFASYTVRPQDPEAPVVTAVHTHPPTGGSMAAWRADTEWAVRQCTEADSGIVAGDFNATLDHPAFTRLGSCVTAADVQDGAGLGTWPTSWPRWAGAAIDHVIVDERSWQVVDFGVLDAEGGSDHRAVVAVLEKRSS